MGYMEDLLKKACERCEQYCGEQHDYTECVECPTYTMHSELVKTKQKLDETKEELYYRNKEHYEKESRDRGYWGIFG